MEGHKNLVGWFQKLSSLGSVAPVVWHLEQLVDSHNRDSKVYECVLSKSAPSKYTLSPGFEFGGGSINSTPPSLPSLDVACFKEI